MRDKRIPFHLSKPDTTRPLSSLFANGGGEKADGIVLPG